MKVIFLDVDGVLNHDDSPGWQDTPYIVDQFCLMQLKRIVRETEAHLVLSSAWRYGTESYKEIVRHLKIANMVLIGQTPIVDFNNRYREIDSWIKSNPNLYIDKVAILDDEVDADTRTGDFFQTDFNDKGLTEEIANRVIEHLK